MKKTGKKTLKTPLAKKSENRQSQSKTKTKTKIKTKLKSQSQKAAGAGHKTSAKVRSAAAHIGKTTKKMVDDVFLKVLGMKVLARAQEITQSLQKEKRSRKKARS
jgi:hypothetical protein